MFADFLNNIILYPFFIVSVRLTGLFVTIPPFNDKSVSIRFRVGSLIVLTFALAPIVSEYIPQSPSLISELVLVILNELLIGILLGLGVKLFFFAINIAGDFMSATMGLQSASMMDPSTHTNTMALSRILRVTAVVLFLVLDMHLYMIKAFIQSYDLVSFNATLDFGAIMFAIIKTVTQLFIVGISNGESCCCNKLYY